jgi:hypothetical protein
MLQVMYAMYQDVLTIVAWELGVAGAAIITFSVAQILLGKAND